MLGSPSTTCAPHASAASRAARCSAPAGAPAAAAVRAAWRPMSARSSSAVRPPSWRDRHSAAGKLGPLRPPAARVTMSRQRAHSGNRAWEPWTHAAAASGSFPATGGLATAAGRSALHQRLRCRPEAQRCARAARRTAIARSIQQGRPAAAQLHDHRVRLDNLPICNSLWNRSYRCARGAARHGRWQVAVQADTRAVNLRVLLWQ